MTTARDLMTSDAEYVIETDTLVTAAQRMRDLDVGALPVCGTDNRLKGIVTDRDIVVRCVADGGDAATATAGSLVQGKTVTVDADADIDEAIRIMKQHSVRRLPVLHGHILVGMLSQADIARNLSPERVGDLLEDISS